MPHFVVVNLAPTDPDTLAAYFKVGGAAVKKHGGKALAGGSREILESNGGGAQAHVILSFPDAQAARDWINDPELADTHALRRAGAQTTITLLDPM
ncbi:DUF1330 domain-containing protein [Actibacterium sp. XHP0104]|uniref:DUF1330 domain-containing protein n=1 Tax=Actibacterium sp. XHP0104 TaxID=2984335 RepID=UPI0021E76245|nr:DUF1330 domain-containing protein [Actibacterium sp. XHP0104]MCV2880826.1 DUF1330 domain-containing protein [Actibacterium sp. XHP0104]